MSQGRAGLKEEWLCGLSSLKQIISGTVLNLPGPQAQLGGCKRVTETEMATSLGQLCGPKPNDPKTPDQQYTSGNRETLGITKVNYLLLKQRVQSEIKLFSIK